jgi:metallo-beta-lactamase class B
MKLADPQMYPGIREDFERSFQTLRALPADIFLASHGSFFNLSSKRAAMANAAHPVDPFIDHEGYLAYIARTETAFRTRLAEQQK